MAYPPRHYWQTHSKTHHEATPPVASLVSLCHSCTNWVIKLSQAQPSWARVLHSITSPPLTSANQSNYWLLVSITCAAARSDSWADLGPPDLVAEVAAHSHFQFKGKEKSKLLGCCWTSRHLSGATGSLCLRWAPLRRWQNRVLDSACSDTSQMKHAYLFGSDSGRQ